MRFLKIIAAWLALSCVLSPGYAERRIALGIGNDRHADLPAHEQMQKAANDARTGGGALRSLGFEVTSGENAGHQAQADRRDALRLFADDTAFSFPELTGRVVDQANILSSAERQRLTAKLADLEERHGGIQLVVATVRSLQNQDIDPYANKLFNHWQLGDKAKNNGVLLLIAPNEHLVRIEVGYGLEGTLTNALSKMIITSAIVPRFKVNDFDGGVEHGVDDIITVLTTGTPAWEEKPQRP